MDFVLLMARLALAAVFGVAGLAKASDLEGTGKAVAGFGVPEKLVTPLAWLLPLIELLVAAALLPLSTAWFGAIGALALLLIFSVAIGVNVVKGNAPDCHCFGQLHSEPVSWSVLARNLLLAAIAAVIVGQGKTAVGLSAFDWLNDLKVGEVVTLAFSVAATALLALALVYLRRVLSQQAAVQTQLAEMKKVIDEDYAEPDPIEREDALPPVEGLPVGAVAPDFSLTSMRDEQTSLSDLLSRGNPVLLFFVSPTCSPCKSLLPMVRAWERDYRDWLTIAVLSRGNRQDNEKKMSQYEIRHLLLQEDSDVAEAYQARWTPAAVLIGRDGKIASPVSSGDDAICALVSHTVTTSAGMQAGNGNNSFIPQISVGNSLFKVGEPAPRFSLPDRQGQDVSLESLLGRPLLLIFWSSRCSFCQAMVADLRRWEADPPPDAPEIVLLNSGYDEARQEDFQALMLVDQDFDIGPLYGTNGTPSAVLIDGEGRIASSLATGANNILALAGIRRKELPLADLKTISH